MKLSAGLGQQWPCCSNRFWTGCPDLPSSVEKRGKWQLSSLVLHNWLSYVSRISRQAFSFTY